MSKVLIRTALYGLPLLATSIAVAAQQPVPLTQVHVEPPLTGGNGKSPAKDISGMACAVPDSAGRRICLLVDDEGSSAQWAVLDGARLTPGAVVTLQAPPAAIAALKAGAKCKGPADKQEADSEAVAYAEPYWYVIGSHGCKRNKRTFSPPQFLVYRIATGARSSDAASAGVALALRSLPPLSDFAEKPLDQNGITVEGLAASGGRLRIGLRAPVVAGRAYLMDVDAAALFAAPTVAASATVVPLSLEADRGIRDLAPLPDGRLLLLTGAAQEQAIPYRLHVLDTATGAATPVAGWNRPGGPTDAKAEGLMVLDAAGRVVRVVVLYDGLPNGAPEVATIALPAGGDRAAQ